MSAPMTTQVLISFDTEFSALLYQRGASAAENFDASITGRTAQGNVGIHWQMDRLDERGLKGVFFIDPMPALVHGRAIVADMVGPVVERGHDVQLHIHTEWLDFAENHGFGSLSGHSIKDFPASAQQDLLALAKSLLEEGGAPAPIAFRAGNFGANDDTLKALATLGLRWDSSVNPVFLGGECHVSLPRTIRHATPHCGVTELPVATLFDRPGHLRPAQVCALSAWEMRALLDHAAAAGDAHAMIVCHSFEMLSRDRQRPNGTVMARFEALCAHVATHSGLESATFQSIRPGVEGGRPEHLPANLLRTGLRMAEQAWAQARYERG